MKINNDLKYLKEHIDLHEVVSFDIFDTLVLRNVFEPVDIFKVVELEYNYQSGKNLDVDFFNARREAEYQARMKRPNQEDIIFDNIYEELLATYSIDVCNTLKAIELETEKRFIVRNDLMYSAFEYAIQQGKKVILISDMYLPENFLSKIVNELGYNGYEKLYVSCEMLKTKHFGTLYQYVKDDLKLYDSSWLHVGDNYHSDVENANKNDIKGYHYQKINERDTSYVIENITDSIFSALEINEKYTREPLSYWDNFGYLNTGRLFYSLNKWLMNNVKNSGSQVYFLARDGYLPKKIYDLYQDKDQNLPDSRYLYTSRRAFQWAGALSNDNELIDVIAGFNPRFGQEITCKEILINIGFPWKDYQEVIKKYGIEIDTVLACEDGTHGKARDFITDHLSLIKIKLEEEKKLVLKYLEQEGLVDNEDATIFDIGWRGSIQKSMQNFLGRKIQGYYFSTNPFVHNEIENYSKGFIATKGIPEENNAFCTKYLMLFELFFTAPHGSLAKFGLLDGVVVPELEPMDVNVYTHEAVEHLQGGCIRFIKTSMNYDRYLTDSNSSIAVKTLKNTIEKSCIVDLVEFSKISNYVGFGVESQLINYVETHTLDNEFNLQRAISESKTSLWPDVFLVQDSVRVMTSDEMIILNEENRILDQVIFNNQVVNLEVELAKKIYRYIKQHGVKSSIIRAARSLKYIFHVYKNR
ncbi:HAD-IA family hydrolase [Vibrio mediterranei]|nr:HAD-IA family hydrolase [Vibrio mediterranei]